MLDTCFPAEPQPRPLLPFLAAKRSCLCNMFRRGHSCARRVSGLPPLPLLSLAFPPGCPSRSPSSFVLVTLSTSRSHNATRAQVPGFIGFLFTRVGKLGIRKASRTNAKTLWILLFLKCFLRVWLPRTAWVL